MDREGCSSSYVGDSSNIQLYIPVELKEEFKKLSKKKMMSVSTLGRQVIAQYVKENE